uniref:Nop domain-containing protein n=1 Tax=Percolomonas cosmopolitus TaxID=63605 RepID=A0A7S1KTK2_9EUKA
MLVLFETASGFAVFKVNDESKLSSADNVAKALSSSNGASNLLTLSEFSKFENIGEAVKAAADIVESKIPKSLKSLLKNKVKKQKDKLAVLDMNLAKQIKDKIGIQCVAYDSSVQELMRGIRTHLDSLLGSAQKEGKLERMQLGLSHSLSRYKLKFSPDKVDTMIVQGISLLDELDKELNVYSMRLKEWYGWHFPELTKIVPDNLIYAKVALALGNRFQANERDLSEVVAEEVAQEIRDSARISMGTDIAEEDLLHINLLCHEIVETFAYRERLYAYIRNRMQAIAPNLTHLVGELVGARLISHAGSLMNLAKHPASTVQILGAEKALFRALKAKQNTPKYGLLYSAQLVGLAPHKFRGRIARVLAAKCAIACRVDALGDMDQVTIGEEARQTVEKRISQLDGKNLNTFRKQSSGVARESAVRGGRMPEVHKESNAYDEAADVQMQDDEPVKVSKKEKKSKKD